MSLRTERLEAQLKKDLGPIFQGYQQGSMITVTEIRVTPDLSLARIYISILAPGRDKEQVFEYLKEHNADIRKELAGKIKNQVRKIPELNFYLDDTAEYVDHLEHLFDKIHEEEKNKPGSSNEEES